MTTQTWHTPITWTEEQFVTHENFNEQIRDNMNYIKEHMDNWIYVYNDGNSGTTTSGGWRTRPLTTMVDPTEIASLDTALDQVTIPAGKYIVFGAAPAGSTGATPTQVGEHQCRLRDVTNGTTLALGSLEQNSVSNGGFYTQSILIGVFTVSITVAIELQHRIQTTPTNNALGSFTAFDEANVQGHFLLWRYGE